MNCPYERSMNTPVNAETAEFAKFVPETLCALRELCVVRSASISKSLLRFRRHVRPRLEAPAARRLHVDVFVVAAVVPQIRRALHALRHEAEEHARRAEAL